MFRIIARAIFLCGILIAVFKPVAALELDSSVPDAPARANKAGSTVKPNSLGQTGSPVFGEANQIVGRSERDVTLEGDAIVRRDGSVIRGDRITYYEAEDEVFVVGNARVVRQGNVFVGKTLRLKLDTNEGEFTEPNFKLPTYGGIGSAEKVEFLGKNRFRFVNGYYTTCKGDHPAWCLRAESVTIDEEEGEGRARSASLYFGNAKILALPVFFFPLGDERKTGVLAPSFTFNNRYGFETALPFYWNIAPNYDLLLTPRIMTKRGLKLDSEFRYLFEQSSGNIRYDRIFNDRDVGGESRYYWGIRHLIPNLADWRIALNAQGVSDDNYFVDFSRTVASSSTLVGSSTRVLPRELIVNRRFGDWNFAATYWRAQSLLETAAAPPYARVPQLTLSRLARDLNGFDISVLADATLYKRPLPDSPEGWRAFLYPQISYPIQKAGWFLTPKIGLHSTTYQLSSNGTNPTNFNRSVPIFSLDAGLIFERATHLFGEGTTQTLEPRMFYVRAPYRDQSLIPIFDTGVTSFDFSQLFSTNRFVGNDRIADQNQLTTALVSRFIEPKTGAERLRLAIGQRLYFSSQRVQLPNVDDNTDARSDLLLAASAQLDNEWSFDSGVQYSIKDHLLPRASFSARYTPPDGRILNFALRYVRDQLGQVDTSWRWPITSKWMALGRLNYSLIDKRLDPLTGAVLDSNKGLVESLVGFEYTDDCWVLRTVFQRYPTSATTFSRSFSIQLELSGFGRIGSDPFDILRRNIPGYRIPDNTLPAPSRFYGYE